MAFNNYIVFFYNIWEAFNTYMFYSFYIFLLFYYIHHRKMRDILILPKVYYILDQCQIMDWFKRVDLSIWPSVRLYNVCF